MGIDFRLINGLFDCRSCKNDTDLCSIRKYHEGDTEEDRECSCRHYGRDPAYKRKEKPDQSSDTSH